MVASPASVNSLSLTLRLGSAASSPSTIRACPVHEAQPPSIVPSVTELFSMTGCRMSLVGLSGVLYSFGMDGTQWILRRPLLSIRP